MTRASVAAYVQLLGGACAQVHEERVEFLADKRYRLLAYLAYSGSWVSRDELAYLFWPDMGTANAKLNLRQLLVRVRSLAWLRGLELNRHSLRWSVASDVAAFGRALEEGDLDGAISLYRGPLLKSLDSYESSEFENWLELAREQLYSSWRGTVMRRARELSERAQHERASALFRLLLAQDALDEEALSAYMAAARAGEREQALLAYRAFSQRLRKELALEPTSATQRLAQALQGERQASPLLMAPDATPASLPIPPTSFVGRKVELAEIAGLLSNPECRLLTLVGPGGVGKTRIALQAARELAQRFEGGVTFVSLVALDSPEAIPTGLAQALGIDLRGHDALGQVIAYLKERRTLLVLDNFERLVEGAAVASELARGCPHLKLLVTSRERLNVEEEWLLPVTGLAFPKRTGVGVASNLPAATLDAGITGQAYEAVELFVARVERMRPHFVLTDEVLPQVLAICGSVEGLPLGLELAAAWARTMPVADIAGEMTRNPDFLSTGTRNLPDRHKSIRATFEYSWKLLAPKEQEVFRKLSVCRGGFSREAAAVVAGAPVAVLAALVDKSLLQVAPAGRYSRHPLLYRYAQEKLAEHPEEEARTEAKHGAYYLRSLQAWAGELRGAKEKQALEDIAQEIGNIRVAWDWAVARCKVEDVLACLPGLADFYELQCWFEEGMEALGRAALAFTGEDARSASLLGTLLARQGRFAWHLGRYREARGLLEASLHRVGPGRGEGRAYALNELATVAHLQGSFAEAKRLCHDSLRLYQELAQPRGVARVLSNLAIVAFAQGEYREAKALHQESLALRRGLGDALAIAYTLANLGDTAYVLGEYQEASALIGESLAIRRASGHRRGIADALNLLGKVTQALGEHAGALALQRESLAIRQEIGDRWGIGRTLDSIGAVLLALGERQAARRHFREALVSAMKIEATPQAVEVLVSMAQLLAHEGEGEKAVAVLAFALHHEASIGEIRGRAKQLLSQLEPRLSAEQMAAATGRGKTRGLEEMVEELLA